MKWTAPKLFLLSTISVAVFWIAVPSDAKSELFFSVTDPGPISPAHHSFADDCNACHEPWRGSDSTKCILCHANDRDLLQRQSTSFHADIGNCQSCHPQHLSVNGSSSAMDHEVLARVGKEQLTHMVHDEAAKRRSQALDSWIKSPSAESPSLEVAAGVTPMEATLDCAACHLNEDVHFGLMGKSCVACHGTDKWSVDSFKHPSASSRSCSQCHQAPPSHYMGHFKMISAKVAGKPKAKVRQCFACHQTNSWIDIKGVGLYKHH